MHPPRRLLAAALLALLAASLPVALHRALAGDAGNLARQLREILEQLRSSATSYGEAAKIYQGVAGCAQPPVSQAAAAAAEALLEANATGSPGPGLEQALRAYLDAVAESPGAVEHCSSSMVYRSLLLALSTPTSLGLIPPGNATGLPAEAASRLASSVVYAATGSRSLAAEAARLAREDPYAGLLLAGLAGTPDPGYWATVNAKAGARGLCLIYALASTDAVPSTAARSALAAAAGRGYARGPGAVLDLAAGALRRGDVFCYAALTSLLDAAYRGYVERILPLYRLPALPAGYTPPLALSNASRIGGVDGLRLLAASIREGITPSLARMDGEIVLSPAASAALVRAERLRAPAAPGSTGYCLVYQALVKSLLGPGAAETQQGWSMAASAAALCYAETGSLEPVELLLVLQPFAEIDPWILAEAARLHGASGPVRGYAERLASLLWSGRLSEAEALNPPSGREAELLHVLVSAGLEAVREGLNPLLVNASGMEAERLLRAAGVDSPRDALLASLDPARVVEDIVGDNATPPLVRLGLFARAAAARPTGGGYVIDYAVARTVSWLVVHMYPWLRGGEKPPAPGQPPEPGTMLYWALGYSTTLEPPAASTAAGEEPGKPRETGQGLQPAGAGGNATGQGLADRLEKLAEKVEESNATGQAKAVAELLRRISQGLRSGDYAEAAAASRALRDILASEPPAGLLAALAREGVSPGEAASTLAEAASIRIGNGYTVDLADAARLAEKLLDAYKDQSRAVLRSILESVSAANRKRASAASSRSRGSSGAGAATGGQPARVLEVHGLGDLVSLLYQALAGGNLSSQPAGGPPVALRLGGNTSRKEGREPGAQPLQPPRPPAPRLPRARLPGWPLALAAGMAAAALLVALLVLRGREIEAMVARARLVAAERRLAGRAPGPEGARGLVVEAFSRLLHLYEAVYGARRPSETHREYGGRLPEAERSRYNPAAAVYEKARFSSKPVTGEDVERLRRAVEEARRGLGGAGRRLASRLSRLLGGGR
ncbi:hypothetical protein CF15_01165 [Pyrodictium occultum]|uniref:Protein-glutamine gamma-glutamyltransferase-like C-terminal domain-containing protein n=1 Tax=Pyrodictium occultum TaxID=2309 RepID=A0A0V8RTU8_PYROC|nr:DUF4129 domain-containing protein [Pyrodictium occultum]KSW11489.1 hypothetical protein CF15_01165 [Pyrodictium occultum]